MYLYAILAYLGVLVILGLYKSRDLKTGDDFLVAGRTLPARVLVFTLLATWIGSGSLFGGAGLGYRAGFPALWQSAGAWAGIALVFFLAHRVRRLAKYTMPDVLELRYGPAARVLGTVVVVIAYTTIAAYQFRGGGRLLNLVAGMDVTQGALITMVFCVVYTALAGMLSVAYLDVGNGIAMLVGVALAVVYLIVHAGGLGPAFDGLRPDQLALFGTLDPIADAGALFLPTMLLLMGEANMYQKFFSAKSEGAARRAVGAWIIGTIVIETLIVSVGVFGSVAIPGLSTGDSEGIVISVASDILPPILAHSAVVRRRRDHRVHGQQLPVDAGERVDARCLPEEHQPRGQRQANPLLYEVYGVAARRRRFYRLEVFRDHPGDGVMGIHDVRGGDYASPAGGFPVASRDARRRSVVHCSGDGHHPRLGDLCAWRRWLPLRAGDGLPGPGACR